MVQVKFKDLDSSSIVRETVERRVMAIAEKFPDLRDGKILVTLGMENSPTQAGPDLFKVKLHVSRGRYTGVTVEKAASNLYVTLAEVIDHMLEVLNRHGDRTRVKGIKNARHLARSRETGL
jgi:ribosome-associated translation inhibitor RaiA